MLFGTIILGCLIGGSLFFFGYVLVALFSSRTSGARKILYAVCLLILILCLGTVLFPSSRPNITAARRAKTMVEMNQLQTAILAYQVEYDEPLAAKNSVELIEILEGKNPRAIPFINIQLRDKNIHGEMLDAWGTPFRITITDAQHPRIQSAGPDKKWNTADDISSGQSSF